MTFCDQNYQIKLLRFYGVEPQSLESLLFQDVLPVSLHSPLERLGRKTLAPLFAALPEPLFLWITRNLKTLLNRQSSKTEKFELHPLEVFLQSHRLSQKGMWHSSPRPLILSHDVDLLSGYQKIDKISQIENKLKLPSTWHFLTQARYLLEPELLQTLVSAGHEIGLHGVWHDLYLGYRSAPYQRAFLKKGLEPLSAYHPVSFRAPLDAQSNDLGISILDAIPDIPMEISVPVDVQDMPVIMETPDATEVIAVPSTPVDTPIETPVPSVEATTPAEVPTQQTEASTPTEPVSGAPTSATSEPAAPSAISTSPTPTGSESAAPKTAEDSSPSRERVVATKTDATTTDGKAPPKAKAAASGSESNTSLKTEADAPSSKASGTESVDTQNSDTESEDSKTADSQSSDNRETVKSDSNSEAKEEDKKSESNEGEKKSEAREGDKKKEEEKKTEAKPRRTMGSVGIQGSISKEVQVYAVPFSFNLTEKLSLGATAPYIKVKKVSGWANPTVMLRFLGKPSSRVLIQSAFGAKLPKGEEKVGSRKVVDYTWSQGFVVNADHSRLIFAYVLGYNAPA
ncbi:hypothetical protein WDW89_03210 [Deltaproteobacteria bacterium TL4]